MPKRVALIALCAATALLGGCGATARDASPTATRPLAAAAHAARAEPVAAPSSTAVAPAPKRAAPKPLTQKPPKLKPTPNACAHNSAARLVKVSLRAQHLWMCQHTSVAYSTSITSGMVGQYTSTPTGDYSIQAVDRDTVLTLRSGAQYHVKYWIPFDAPLFGFHDSSWQGFPYGSSKYKTQGSHGCVHMPLTAIAFLARWAGVGAKVSIRA